MSTALTNARQLWTTDPQRTFSGSAPAEAGGIMEIVMDSTVYTVYHRRRRQLELAAAVSAG